MNLWGITMKESDLKKFDRTEKRRIFAEEQSKFMQQVIDRFIEWAFDCQTDQGLMISLNKLRGEYLTTFNKFTESK